MITYLTNATFEEQLKYWYNGSDEEHMLANYIERNITKMEQKRWEEGYNQGYDSGYTEGYRERSEGLV